MPKEKIYSLSIVSPINYWLCDVVESSMIVHPLLKKYFKSSQ